MNCSIRSQNLRPSLAAAVNHFVNIQPRFIKVKLDPAAEYEVPGHRLAAEIPP